MQATSLPIGADVFTLDEVRVGKVQTIEGAFFEVHPDGREGDYWLEADCAVPNPLSGRVIVAFKKDELKDYRLHIQKDMAGRPAFVPDKDPRTIDERLATPPREEGDGSSNGNLLDGIKNALRPGNRDGGDDADLAGLLEDISRRLDNVRAGDVMSVRGDPECRIQTQHAIETAITRLRGFQAMLA